MDFFLIPSYLNVKVNFEWYLLWLYSAVCEQSYECQVQVRCQVTEGQVPAPQKILPLRCHHCFSLLLLSSSTAPPCCTGLGTLPGFSVDHQNFSSGLGSEKHFLSMQRGCLLSTNHPTHQRNWTLLGQSVWLIRWHNVWVFLINGSSDISWDCRAF